MNCPHCESSIIEEVDRRFYRGGIIVFDMVCGDCGNEWEIEEEEYEHA
jgi:hypothetical protein